jgi:hypothetical protein
MVCFIKYPDQNNNDMPMTKRSTILPIARKRCTIDVRNRYVENILAA